MVFKNKKWLCQIATFYIFSEKESVNKRGGRENERAGFKRLDCTMSQPTSVPRGRAQCSMPQNGALRHQLHDGRHYIMK